MNSSITPSSPRSSRWPCDLLIASYVISAAVFASARPAWANGDTFFNSTEIPGNPQYVVFGTVKDSQGHYLLHATVTVSVVKHMLQASAQTDVLGRFRTPDVGREIEELGYPIDPALFIVFVDYPGYHIAHREFRGKYRQNKGAVEINFIMEKNGAK
jgi:hypothetical protein